MVERLDKPLLTWRPLAVPLRLVALLLVKLFLDAVLEVEPMRVAVVVRLEYKRPKVAIPALLALLLLP